MELRNVLRNHPGQNFSKIEKTTLKCTILVVNIKLKLKAIKKNQISIAKIDFTSVGFCNSNMMKAMLQGKDYYKVVE